jgi:CheY-like chemotaxis protein
MPEIDGFKVANSIRAIESVWFNTLKDQSNDFRKTKCKRPCPIIAVTACTSSDIDDLS